MSKFIHQNKLLFIEIILVISLVFSWGMIILKVPIPTGVGLWVRYGFEALLIPIFVVIFLGLYNRTQLAKIVGLTLTLSIFGLGLSGLWSNAASEMQVAAGGIYFSDASQYLADANRLLSSGTISSFATRHPFSTGLLASLLFFSNHNLQISLVFLVLIVALACFLATWEIRLSLGAGPAALFLLFLFIFYRRFSGLPDSENLGLALGAIGFALLWGGAREKQLKWIWMGLFFTSMGVNTRPGAFFILPALIIWAVVSFGEKDKRGTLNRLLIGSGIVLSAFLINMGVAAAVGSSNGLLFSNFTSTFYGITHGGAGWEAVYQQHPEIYDLPQLHATIKMWQWSTAELVNRPLFTLQAVGDTYLRYFSVRDESIFGFFSGSELIFFDVIDLQHQGTYVFIRVSCLLLSLFGIVHAWRNRGQIHNRLLLFCLGGLVLSMPFLPAQDAALMRVYAATLPMIAMFPVYGFYHLIRIIGKKQKQQTAAGTNKSRHVIPLLLGGCLVLAAAGGPLLMHIFNRPLLFSPSECPTATFEADVRISPGSYIQIVPDSSIQQTLFPKVRRNDYQHSLESFLHPNDISNLRLLNANTIVMNAYDLNRQDSFWLVMDSSLLPHTDGIYALCGQWDERMFSRGLHYYYVHKFKGKIDS